MGISGVAGVVSSAVVVAVAGLTAGTVREAVFTAVLVMLLVNVCCCALVIG